MLDGDNTWTGNNTFENPVTIGDSTAATQDWTLNNAIGVIPGNTSILYKDKIIAATENIVEIEETEFSAWWCAKGTQGAAQSHIRIMDVTNGLENYISLTEGSTASEGTSAFIPKGHHLKVSYLGLVSGTLSYVKAVFASNTEVSNGVPGDTAITCLENLTITTTQIYVCSSMPADGTVTVQGSNATSNNGFCWIRDITNGTEQITPMLPQYTAGGSLDVAKGHNCTIHINNLSPAKITFTPFKGQPQTKPDFVLQS